MRIRAAASAAACALACALATAGCGLPETPATKLQPPRGGGAAPLRGVTDDVVVSRAVRALVADDSGRFSSRLYIAGGATEFVDAEGGWRFSTAESRLTLDSTPQRGEPSTYEFRVFSRGFYLRVTEGDRTGCWTPYAIPETPPWTPAGNVTAPSHVQALLSARGGRQRSPKGTATGTVALGDAIGVLGPIWTRAVQQAGDRAVRVRLAAAFSLDQGRFSGWHVEGPDIADALAEAGIRMRPELRSQLLAYSARVTVRPVRSPVDVTPPDGTC